MIVLKKNITSFDKYVFSLINYGLPFNLYPCLFTPFVGGGYQCYVLLNKTTSFQAGCNYDLGYLSLRCKIPDGIKS